MVLLLNLQKLLKNRNVSRNAKLKPNPSANSHASVTQSYPHETPTPNNSMRNWVITIFLVHHHFHLEPHNLVSPYFPLLFSLSQKQYLLFNLQITATPVMVLCQTSVTLYFMRTETIIDPKSTDHFTCYQPSFFF